MKPIFLCGFGTYPWKSPNLGIGLTFPHLKQIYPDDEKCIVFDVTFHCLWFRVNFGRDFYLLPGKDF